MTETGTRPRDRRASRKLQTFRRIQEEAMRLFLDKGYDATTVEEVAAAAGVSHMTVYRHFPTKEALVLTDEWDALVPAAIRDRPPGEGPLDAIEGAFIDLLSDVSDDDVEMIKVRMSLALSNRDLQAASLFNTLATMRVVVAALRERGSEDEATLQVVAATALAIGSLTAMDWSEQGHRASLTQMLRDRFTTLRQVVAASNGAGAPADDA